MSDSELSDVETRNQNESGSESDDEIHNEKVLNELQEKADTDSDDSEAEDRKSKPNDEVKSVKIDEADEENRKKLEAIKREREEDAPKTIFVGNLAITVKKNQILKFFQKHGSIKSVRLRTNDGKKITHQKQIKQLPALNGYVVFNKESSAKKSLDENGKLFKGKHIRVNMANEKNYENKEKSVLFIGNLKYNATDEDLHEIFSSCGEIEYIRTLRNELGCKGIGYVGFKSADAVHLGLELNGTMLDNRPIRVERYVSNKKQKDQKKNKRLAKKAKGKGKISKNNQVTKGPINQPAKKHKPIAPLSQSDKIEKKPKDKKSFAGQKAERTKKKHKLGQGERQKRSLAKKIAPRVVT